ncbi:hypothetical protein H0N96_03665 [Candidatus Micrarchaeota archaeon]|nr:hypothetical protein [Candidatus Micrarchaeota archaeon]
MSNSLAVNRKAFGFLFFGIALFAAALLFGCLGGGSASPSAAPSGTMATPPANAAGVKFNFKDSELNALYEASQTPQAPKTSFDNLREAYDAQKISKEDFIVYSLQAALSPAELPSQYSGAALVDYDVSNEIMMAVENWDSLSPEAKAKIEPLILLPGEEKLPDSFKTLQAVQTAARKNEELSFAGELDFAGEQYETFYLQAISGKAQVIGFLPVGYTPAAKAVLNERLYWIKLGAVDAYGKFKSLLGFEPSNEVWFYVEDLPAGTRGEASIRATGTDPVVRCRLTVDVNQTRDEKTTKSIAAHELFHCFQFHIPLLDWNNTDEKWLKEATAVWSQHYVYPDFNIEHSRLPLFFNTREKPLVNVESLKEYADYAFFYFLDKTAGPQTIAKILKDAKTKGVKEALKSAPNYEEKHADYSVWNWNRDPIFRYTDSPSFPKIGVSGSALKPDKIDAQGVREVRSNVDAGAAEYRFFEVSQDAGIKRIIFKFTDANDKKHQRRALVKIGNSWTEEFWNSEMEKTFCLNKPDERVTAIVLIYSNSDLEDSYFGVYQIDSEGECPLEITGRTVMKYSWQGLPQLGEGSGTMISDDEVEFDADEGAYVLTNRSMSCSEHSSNNVQMEIAGETISISTSVSGSGSAIETYEKGDAPIKVSFDEEDQQIHFIVDPQQKNSAWATFTETTNGETTTRKGDCGGAIGIPNVLDLPLSEEFLEFTGDVKRLHGKHEFSYNGVTGSVEFDYVLTEKPKA